MNAKLTVLRALSFVFARRVLRITSLTSLIVVVCLVILTWVLAAQLSAWWWLLLLPIIAMTLFVAVILLLAMTITRSIYHTRLTKIQSKKLQAFADKIQRLAEKRGLGWPLLIILSLKDLLFHKQLRTVIEIAQDATSLRRDFAELEMLLK